MTTTLKQADSTAVAKQTGKARVCFVVVFFGQWPDWLDYFFKTCSANPDFHWRIFTECSVDVNPPENVILHSITRAEFDERVGKVFQIPYKFSYGYKLCDMKPAYGEIFADYLEQYDFWGYTDVDLVLGRLGDCITDEVLDQHDVITASPYMIVGHCTLLRNNEFFNLLYRSCDRYLEMLSSRDYEVFDEKVFAEHLLSLKDTGEIKFFQKSMQVDDCLIWWSGRPKFVIHWKQGLVRDVLIGRSLGYFHFIQSKRKDGFRYEPLPADCDEFFVDEHGLCPLVTAADRKRYRRSLLSAFVRTLPFYLKSALKRVLPAGLRQKLRGAKPVAQT
ncbi:DUF6625 family protein [Cerasicoccus maritimus]|uniref:DUF6625 family protein n=1 Tax=Cerasicoccus maritimus TaxID=490089 RepID=UPI002852AA87|nr:DUF6625 family protein [Cerasicoccus maritimus]